MLVYVYPYNSLQKYLVSEQNMKMNEPVALNDNHTFESPFDLIIEEMWSLWDPMIDDHQIGYANGMIGSKCYIVL